jgi:hypothetical protein
MVFYNKFSQKNNHNTGGALKQSISIPPAESGAVTMGAIGCV